MEQLLWSVIQETKSGQEYLNPETQYENLKSILRRLDKTVVQQLEEEWRKKVKVFTNDNNEFDKLHVSFGGIVNAGDDGFYMDFANWVIAQGEELFKRFQEEGHTAILDYIKKHNVTEEDYRYECMIYAFSQYEE